MTTTMDKRGVDVCGNVSTDAIPSCSSRARTTISRLSANYGTFAKRLVSFKHWPKSLPVDPTKLAEAGLYHTGRGDETICFHCENGLKDWEKEDDPWIEHAVWYPGCDFVLREKGEEFVRKAREVKYEKLVINRGGCDSGYGSPTEEKPNVSFGEPKKEEQAKSDDKLCIICCDQERSIVFIPCGHFSCCSRCSVQFSTCPTCRKPITSFVRAFLS